MQFSAVLLAKAWACRPALESAVKSLEELESKGEKESCSPPEAGLILLVYGVFCKARSKLRGWEGGVEKFISF